MKILIAALSLLSVMNAYSMTKAELYSALKPRLIVGSRQTAFYEGRDYFHYSLPTLMPRKRDSEVWTSDDIMFFSKGASKVSQIALISYRCGVKMNEENQKIVTNQAKKLFAKEGKMIFGKELLLKDRDIEMLGPMQSEIRKINIQWAIPKVQRVRLSRGMYKCDGKRGFGYRLDFFLV